MTPIFNNLPAVSGLSKLTCWKGDFVWRYNMVGCQATGVLFLVVLLMCWLSQANRQPPFQTLVLRHLNFSLVIESLAPLIYITFITIKLCHYFLKKNAKIVKFMRGCSTRLILIQHLGFQTSNSLTNLMSSMPKILRCWKWSWRVPTLTGTQSGT